MTQARFGRNDLASSPYGGAQLRDATAGGKSSVTSSLEAVLARSSIALCLALCAAGCLCSAWALPTRCGITDSTTGCHTAARQDTCTGTLVFQRLPTAMHLHALATVPARYSLRTALQAWCNQHLTGPPLLTASPHRPLQPCVRPPERSASPSVFCNTVIHGAQMVRMDEPCSRVASQVRCACRRRSRASAGVELAERGRLSLACLRLRRARCCSRPGQHNKMSSKHLCSTANYLEAQPRHHPGRISTFTSDEGLKLPSCAHCEALCSCTQVVEACVCPLMTSTFLLY